MNAPWSNDRCALKKALKYFLPYYSIIKDQKSNVRYTQLTCRKLDAAKVPLKKMVEVNGFEPMTSCVQGRRSPS